MYRCAHHRGTLANGKIIRKYLRKYLGYDENNAIAAKLCSKAQVGSGKAYLIRLSNCLEDGSSIHKSWGDCLSAAL
jgi:hypothetical protein